MDYLKLRAPELKAQFAVYGHFYGVQINGQYCTCRSTLEIISHEQTPSTLNEILSASPAVLVIMMNPGSSRPLDKTYEPLMLNNYDELIEKRELTATVPDTTQYQIMRVMAHMGWAHARVLNLSDLREPKSPRLFSTLAELGEGKGLMHSIFHEQRRQELNTLLPQNNSTQVIAGWGRAKALLPLAELCLRALPFPIVGVATNQEMTLYAHPSPMLQAMKDAWLTRVTTLLRELEKGNQ